MHALKVFRSPVWLLLHKLSSPHYRYIRKMRRGDRLPLTQTPFHYSECPIDLKYLSWFSDLSNLVLWATFGIKLKQIFMVALILRKNLLLNILHDTQFPPFSFCISCFLVEKNLFLWQDWPIWTEILQVLLSKKEYSLYHIDLVYCFISIQGYLKSMYCLNWNKMYRSNLVYLSCF